MIVINMQDKKLRNFHTKKKEERERSGVSLGCSESGGKKLNKLAEFDGKRG